MVCDYALVCNLKAQNCWVGVKQRFNVMYLKFLDLVFMFAYACIYTICIILQLKHIHYAYIMRACTVTVYLFVV